MPLNCLIIDDEPLARDVLKRFVAATETLNLVGVCKDAQEAAALLEKHKNIDVLFLDINMPGVSGIHFLKSLINAPDVIFTTAYPEHAVEGFELDAVDYLLKPFSFERFQVAVAKVLARKGTVSTTAEEAHILIKSNKVLHKVYPLRIQYIEAYGDYVKVVLEDQQIVTNSTFSGMLTQLEPFRFIRIHKSFAINLTLLKRVQGNTVLIEDKTVPIGQKYKAGFLERLESNGKDI